jgi:hypothetical protein
MFLRCIDGEVGGVDGEGSSMTSFMGLKILEELLFMGRVGVFIDNAVTQGYTKADVKSHPYLYTYTAENILNWTCDPNNPQFLMALLLRDMFPELDEFGLPKQITPRYRLYRKAPDGVTVTLYDEQGQKKPYFSDISGNKIATKLLKLSHIPFIMGDLGTSLLQDVADYQIAHLNLASSDIWYAWTSNFPFYVEQFDPYQQQFMKTRPERAADFEPVPGFNGILGQDEIVNQTQPNVINPIRTPQNDGKEITVGPSTGRRYPKGMEKPGFIHPSPEPLMASMEKENQIIFEIRQLVFLAVSNLQNKMASAESKGFDIQGLEAGLAFIGMELENIERFIANMWHEYETTTEVTKVTYPEQYSLKSDDERRKDAEEMRKLQTAVTSRSFQKRVQKDIVRILYGGTLLLKDLEIFDKEIDDAKAPTADPEILEKDHEAGFVSDTTASEARGYEVGEAKKAQQDHANRLARIQESQMSNAAARGLRDQAVIPNKEAESEKDGKKGRSKADKAMYEEEK